MKIVDKKNLTNLLQFDPSKILYRTVQCCLFSYVSVSLDTMYINPFITLIDITDIPDVIPTDDITQHERTVTSVVVQWKVPNYYNAPITMYSLNLCENINDDCITVNGYLMNINAGEHTSGRTVRYSLHLIIVDVVICSYLHRYNISGLQPFSSTPYLFSIRAINDIGSADFSEPVALILVNRSEIV